MLSRMLGTYFIFTKKELWYLLLRLSVENPSKEKRKKRKKELF